MSWLSTSYGQSFEDGGYEPPRPFSASSNANDVTGDNNEANNDNVLNNDNPGEVFVRESPYFKEESLERVRKKDGKTDRQKDKRTERQKEGKKERGIFREGKTERLKYGKTERQKE